MATFTMRSDRYPAGATVQAHPQDAKIPGGPPASAQVDSAVVAADYSTTFTALLSTTRYVAYAQVGAEHRYVNFTSWDT